MSHFNAFKHTLRAELEALVDDYPNVGLVVSGALIQVTGPAGALGPVLATASVGEAQGYRYPVAVYRARGNGFPEYYRKAYDFDRVKVVEEAVHEVRHILADAVDTPSPF